MQSNLYFSTGIGGPSGGYSATPTTQQDISTARQRSSERLKPVDTYKDMLKANLNLLQNDPSKLGLTEAQRRQMLSEAQQADAAQRQAQVQALGQQALAGGPIAQQQLQQAAKTAASEGGEAAAQASADVSKLNQRLIEQRKQQIWADLDAARQRAREDSRFWTQFGIDAASTIGSVVAGAV